MILTQLEKIDDRGISFLYISDHGESLGENNIYLHGAPLYLAPDEQIDIPFFVKSNLKYEFKSNLNTNAHATVSHTILDLLGINTKFYNKDLSLVNQFD